VGVACLRPWLMYAGQQCREHSGDLAVDEECISVREGGGGFSRVDVWRGTRRAIPSDVQWGGVTGGLPLVLIALARAFQAITFSLQFLLQDKAILNAAEQGQTLI
jgi:hypothetical protein